MSQQEIEALAAIEEGNYALAISLYQQLAAEHPLPRSIDFHLLAVRTMITAGQTEQAESGLERMTLFPLTDEQALQHQVMTAELILRHDPDQALEVLATPVAAEHTITRLGLLAEFHRVRALAYTQVGNHLESVREYILREIYLESPDKVQDNQSAIWLSLSNLSSEALERLHTSPPPDLLSGWIELALIMRDNNLNVWQTEERLTQWHRHYPHHPLLYTLERQWLNTKQTFVERPEQVALLLPFSGRYARAAEAIRDGFLAARYADAGVERRPILRLYDTASDPQQAVTLYEQAIEEGAGFVVGPLDKQAVAMLTRRFQLPVATLALNRYDITPPDNLYQFSLAPEGEARQAANWAWYDGHRRATVLVPDNTLGRRVASSFNRYWEELGGTVVAESYYDPGKNDFSQPITRMLAVDNSKARRRNIANLIGTRLEFTPRRRQDIDFIFVLAQPLQARLIKPQLKFHYAKQLPVYATSHVFSGEVDVKKDRDLDNTMFVDMPWTLDQARRAQYVGQAEAALLEKHAGALQRLVAFGIDAYQLVAEVKRLESYPNEVFTGVTGGLSMNEDRIIERELDHAIVSWGKPRLQPRMEKQQTGEQENASNDAGKRAVR